MPHGLSPTGLNRRGLNAPGHHATQSYSIRKCTKARGQATLRNTRAAAPASGYPTATRPGRNPGDERRRGGRGGREPRRRCRSRLPRYREVHGRFGVFGPELTCLRSMCCLMYVPAAYQGTCVHFIYARHLPSFVPRVVVLQVTTRLFAPGRPSSELPQDRVAARCLRQKGRVMQGGWRRLAVA